MATDKVERGNTFKSTVTFKSGSIYTDPSGERAYIKVYRPDGSLYIDSSGAKEGTGIYIYYISTQLTDDLGIYCTEWKGLFNFGGKWGYAPKYERDSFLVTTVE